MYHTAVRNTLLDQLSSYFSKAIAAAFPDLPSDLQCAEVTKSTQKQFGHYQCNSAMKLVKILKKSPKVIAEAIEKAIADVKGVSPIEKIEIAGNGFLNVWIKPEVLEKRIVEILKSDHLGVQSDEKLKIVIDFSSPNTAKEMHVGHLRSTIIGDCLAKVFEFLGNDVVRLNHIGDWGTAFGMLITYIRENSLQNLPDMQLSDLVRYYRDSKRIFDEDEGFKKRSQLAVVALQGGDLEALRLWKTICAISAKAYQEIYDLLDVHLIERGESFYNPMLASVVKDLEDKGLVTISDGARCIFLDDFLNREGESLPLMIQKSDGGYNYDTTDMATILHRIRDEKADRIIYVTDAGQSTHFQMIFKAAEKAAYLDPKKVRVDHVPFGLVLGQDGKKFRTRSGSTERLIDLLETAVETAHDIIKERNPDWSEKDQQSVAKILGIGAVKYADLSSNRISDYTFSYERMLRFEGNTAAFIMYSYVRAQGIKRKSGKNIDELLERAAITLTHPSEIDLALKLSQFGEVLEELADSLMPNRLTEYLYLLAEAFNAFFRDCRVEGVSEESSRLLLVEAAGRTLKQGLALLGVKEVEKM